MRKSSVCKPIPASYLHFTAFLVDNCRRNKLRFGLRGSCPNERLMDWKRQSGAKQEQILVQRVYISREPGRRVCDPTPEVYMNKLRPHTRLDSTALLVDNGWIEAAAVEAICLKALRLWIRVNRVSLVFKVNCVFNRVDQFTCCTFCASHISSADYFHRIVSCSASALV